MSNDVHLVNVPVTNHLAGYRNALVKAVVIYPVITLEPYWRLPEKSQLSAEIASSIYYGHPVYIRVVRVGACPAMPLARG